MIGYQTLGGSTGVASREAAREWSNQDWLERLQGESLVREEAIVALRDYMQRAVYVYLLRRRSDLSGLHPTELSQLAEDYTQEALLIVLRELEGFRGDSKLTTWAYRIVINLAIGKLRRKHWRDISLEHSLSDEDRPSLLTSLEDESSADPQAAIEQRQVLERLRSVISESLTERQRTVLTGIVLEGASTAAMAARLDTNRNNIYKILHDARKKLRGCLEEMGVTAQQSLAAFADGTSIWTTGDAPLFDEVAIGAD